MRRCKTPLPQSTVNVTMTMGEQQEGCWHRWKSSTPNLDWTWVILSLVPLNSCPAPFKGKTLQLVKLCVPLSLSRLILNVSGVMNSSTASMPKPSQKLQSTQVNLRSQGTGAHQRNRMEVPSLTGTTVLKHTTATSTSSFWSWSVES